MAQTSRLVLEIDSRDAEQKAADTRKALEALEGAGLRIKPAMDKASDGLEEVGQSADKAGSQVKEQRASLEALLGSIDPVTRKLGELDRQEKELSKNRKLGLIDTDTFNEYQSKINATRADLGRFNADMTKTGISAKQTAAALRGVPAQFTDIAVSLQSGQAPLTVFLQQGGQLKDMFGGAGPAAKALGGYVLGLINPFTVAAAAAAALGVAYYQGSKEQDEFRNALILTGNAAGTSASALGSMAERVSKSVGTVGAASAVLAQLAGSSKIPAASFEMIATAALKMQDATGKAASATIADFEKLAKDPVKYSKELNDQLGYLTAGTYAQIAALEKQGDQQGAANLAEKAYAEALETRADKIKQNLGFVETAWDAVGKAAKGAWDAALDIGREDTFDQKLAKLEDRLQRVRNASVAPTMFDDNPNLGELGAGEKGAQTAITDLYVTKAEDERRVAARKAISDANKEAIESQEKLNAALKASDPPAKKLAERYAQIEKQIESARSKGVIYSQEQIKQLRDAAAEQFKDKPLPKEKAYTENAGIKALDQAKQQYAILFQQNSLIGSQNDGVQKIGAAQQALIKWEQELSDIKGKKTLTADQQSLLANQQLIGAQLKRNAGLERETELKQLSIDQSQKLLAFQENLNSQLKLAQGGLNEKLAGAGLGDQALQRLQEQQQIRQSYQSQMDRLTYDYNKGDKTAASSDLYNQQTAALQDALNKRLTMQTQYYAATDKQQSDWTLGASSAFHTYAEQAANVAGQTRSLFTNAFSSMEDGIVNFVKTGKLSFKDLADGIITDLIRIGVRKAAVGIFTSVAGAGLGFSSGGYTGDGGKYQPKGVVHGGEFVVQKSAVQQPGAREFLERMNAGKGYADGGYVNPAGAVTATNAAARSPSAGSMPPISQTITVQGTADEATLARIQQAAQQGAQQGYNLVLRDFKKNGPARQLIARNR